MSPARATAVLLLTTLAAPPLASDDAETRLSLDVKDAQVQKIVGLLVELGGRQVVFDPGLDCSLTLKLHAVRWCDALEASLRACGLAQEETGGVVWVTTNARLREEAEGRRRLKEARRPVPGSGLAVYRLSYARAEELAPLLQRLVGPGGELTVDPRTNTVIIRY